MGRGPYSKVCPPLCRPNAVSWLHCVMFVLIASLCLAFSDADVESDFVLMTSAYCQYLRDSRKQHLAVGS